MGRAVSQSLFLPPWQYAISPQVGSLSQNRRPPQGRGGLFLRSNCSSVDRRVFNKDSEYFLAQPGRPRSWWGSSYDALSKCVGDFWGSLPSGRVLSGQVPGFVWAGGGRAGRSHPCVIPLLQVESDSPSVPGRRGA